MIRMFPNYLKLTQKIASTRNLQSTNIRIVTDANQQSKLSKNKQGIYLTNKTKNIQLRHYQFQLSGSSISKN